MKSIKNKGGKMADQLIVEEERSDSLESPDSPDLDEMSISLFSNENLTQ
jgi:hypothetical protein